MAEMVGPGAGSEGERAGGAKKPGAENEPTADPLGLSLPKDPDTYLIRQARTLFESSLRGAGQSGEYFLDRGYSLYQFERRVLGTGDNEYRLRIIDTSSGELVLSHYYLDHNFQYLFGHAINRWRPSLLTVDDFKVAISDERISALRDPVYDERNSAISASIPYQIVTGMTRLHKPLTVVMSRTGHFYFVVRNDGLTKKSRLFEIGEKFKFSSQVGDLKVRVGFKKDLPPGSDPFQIALVMGFNRVSSSDDRKIRQLLYRGTIRVSGKQYG